PWQTVQATFSADKKVLTMTDPQGAVTTMQYDSLQRLWKVTDALSRVVERIYDDANRISSVKDPAGITAVTYTYRDNGQVATIKDARNNVTTYSFDGHDRPEKTTYPDATFEQITGRDGNSNPLTMVTRSGATFTLTFDELNRIKTKTPSGQPTVTTVYDIAGRVVTVSTPVVAGDPSSGTFTNFYDTAGRFYKEQYPDGLSVTHQLDANGNLTRTTYPDGYFIERVFDQLNRLTDIKLNGAGTSAVQFQYDALSRRTKLIYENGCSTSYGFEQDNDLNGLLHNFVGSNVNFSYAFDSVGQMLSQRTSDPANFRWTPGAPGTVSYGTANSINQYPTVGGVGFSYSTDGSLTNDGVFKYEFNSERMMTRVRDAGTNAIVADYLYDPALRQRQKNVGGTKTNFYYAGWQRLADYDGTTNTLQQRFVYGPGLDEVLIQISSGGTKTYFHGNHQGSVIATTDASGAVLSRFKYSPSGESPSMSGTSHGYTGQRYDSETGLYYYKMRYYSPKLGRFLQADPIGYQGGTNLYLISSLAPMGVSDPYGLAASFHEVSFTVYLGKYPWNGLGDHLNLMIDIVSLNMADEVPSYLRLFEAGPLVGDESSWVPGGTKLAAFQDAFQQGISARAVDGKTYESELNRPADKLVLFKSTNEAEWQEMYGRIASLYNDIEAELKSHYYEYDPFFGIGYNSNSVVSYALDKLGLKSKVSSSYTKRAPGYDKPLKIGDYNPYLTPDGKGLLRFASNTASDSSAVQDTVLFGSSTATAVK
ncbi:MAG: hypothetical protein JNN26_23500, partial [Candidatus Obscuribacter sp.]|nr:hypothetical protein [Candidatus Obscuribacter sp.]